MLERLIRKPTPENIGYGTVLAVEPRNRRALVRWRHGIEVYAAYLPSDFPELQEEQTVAIGSTAGQPFIIRLVDSAIPSETLLLEV